MEEKEETQVLSVLIILSALILLALGNINMWGIAKKLEQPIIFMKFSVVSILILSALIFGFILSKTPERNLLTFGVVSFIVSLALLGAVEFFGVERYGAKRWISFKGITLQPTEIIKAPIVLILSYLLAKASLKKLLVISSIVVMVPVYLIINHPDYGSALSIIFVFILSVFVSKISLRYILAVLIICVVSLPIIWKYGLKDYHRERILGLFNQEERALEIAYQTVQSKIAIASGGLYGAGIGKGEHGSGQWIPNLHTDFAFASISEDLGFIGSAATIILLTSIFILLIMKSLLSEPKQTKALCVLSAGLFFFHAFVNIGMVSGILPVIGIPLTFISYAGSHNITMGFLIGVCAGARTQKITPIKPL